MQAGVKFIDVDEYLGLIGQDEKAITLSELEDMNLEQWNYPLDELGHVLENDLNVVMVRFPKESIGYEYRWCEI